MESTYDERVVDSDVGVLVQYSCTLQTELLCTVGKGSGRIKRRCQNVGFIVKAHGMIDRGAQHKVYERTNTIQLQAPHICRARAARHFCGEHRTQHPNLGARADRVEERRGSRRRCRIDHGEALLRRRLAQDEPAQGPGGPCRAPPLCRLPPPIQSRARLTLARLLRFDRDLHCDTATVCAEVAVQTAVATEHHSAVSACPGSDRRSRDATCRKKFLPHPLLSTLTSVVSGQRLHGDTQLTPLHCPLTTHISLTVTLAFAASWPAVQIRLCPAFQSAF